MGSGKKRIFSDTPPPYVNVTSFRLISATPRNMRKQGTLSPFSDAAFPKTDTSADFSTTEAADSGDFSMS